MMPCSRHMVTQKVETLFESLKQLRFWGEMRWTNRTKVSAAMRQRAYASHALRHALNKSKESDFSYFAETLRLCPFFSLRFWILVSCTLVALVVRFWCLNIHQHRVNGVSVDVQMADFSCSRPLGRSPKSIGNGQGRPFCFTNARIARALKPEWFGMIWTLHLQGISMSSTTRRRLVQNMAAVCSSSFCQWL